MSYHATLSLQLTVKGEQKEFLLSIGEEACGFSCAREVIENIGEFNISSARLGHVEDDGSVTPWLTETELLDWSEIPF